MSVVSRQPGQHVGMFTPSGMQLADRYTNQTTSDTKCTQSQTVYMGRSVSLGRDNAASDSAVSSDAATDSMGVEAQGMHEES